MQSSNISPPILILQMVNIGFVRALLNMRNHSNIVQDVNI